MRPVVYQICSHLYVAKGGRNIPFGTREENGCGHMADLDNKALARLVDMGVTHVWCMGLLRHATRTHHEGVPDSHPDVVKGMAGSPFAITDYYDIDPALAAKPERRHEEFANMLKRVHKAGLKLIMDFVPNHVARQYDGLHTPEGAQPLGEGDDTSVRFARDNNFYYLPGETLRIGDYTESPARATGNDVFSAQPSENDWYETVKLNYGVDYTTGSRCFDPVPDTWVKMTQILKHWASRGVDAFRCDMAEMVPVEFWHYAIGEVKAAYPEVRFVAEVYNPTMYRDYIHTGGFDWLYDKVGLYDTVKGVMKDQLWAGEITHAWLSVDDIRPSMLGFLENHDEERIASRQFCGQTGPGRAGMIATAAVCMGPLMVYMGQELGENGMDVEGYRGADGRTTIFDYWTMDKIVRQKSGKLTDEERDLQDFYSRLMRACNECAPLREGAFYDLMYVNPPSETFDARHTYVCLRHSSGQTLLAVCNFTGEERAVDVVIPQEAIEHLGIKASERPLKWKDQLSDYTITAPLQADRPIKVLLPPFSGRLLMHEHV